MTRDDIIRMAREAGFQLSKHGIFDAEPEELERFAALVADAVRGDYFEGWEEGYKAGVIAEREACAKLCDELRDEDGFEPYGTECAAAIRARGET